jgi:hypothetical protein
MIQYSLHKINDVASIPFSEDEYSKFKFGDDAMAEKFGQQLAEGYIKNYLEKNEVKNDIIVFSSPYDFIPTASYYLKNYFIYYLNLWLIENNKNVVCESKIFRTTTYKEDYGALSASERLKLIGNDSFYIDKEFIKNKDLIFIDDIKITGSHEFMIKKMIDKFNLENKYSMIYFSELINSNINPNIENFLNYHYVESLEEINDIIFNSRFVFNTRVVKFILSSPIDHFNRFLSEKENHFKNQLLNFSIGNKYHLMDAYSTNLNELKNILLTKQKTEYGY